MFTFAILIMTSFSSFGMDSIAELCDQSEYAATQACARGDSSCATLASKCVADCGVVNPSWGLLERKHVSDQKNKCVGLSGGASTTTAAADKSACSDTITQLAACKKNCKPDYDSCVTTCRKVADTVERTEAFRRCDANYRGKPIDTAKAEPVDPRDDDKKDDPAAEEPTDPTDDAVAPGDNQNTGDTNTVAQMPSLEGLGNTSYGDTSLSNDASAIDFSKGPTPDRGGYQKAAAGVMDTSGAQGMAAQGHNNFNGELPTGELVGGANKNDGGNSGGGANGGGGNGGPPMNSSMQAGNNGAGANGGKRPSGGGNYRNGAAEYLNRHSPFSFQSGGNSTAPGNNGKRNVANDKNKKSFGPRYNKKENDGKDALHRLFGNGTTPASYRRNPYAGSAACRDTVFCSMEVYHNKIERLPNHDINPDSL